MFPKHIILDVDGVLANYATSHVRLINGIWEGRLPETFVPQGWEGYGLTEREHEKVMNAQFMSYDFWRGLEPYENNCKELREAYFRITADSDLWFVTARTRTVGHSTRSQTEEWLEEHTGIIDPHVIVVPRSIDKPTLYHLLWIKDGMASLDDYADIVRMCENQARHQAYLFAQPWNMSNHQPLATKAVGSIGAFFDAIDT